MDLAAFPAEAAVLAVFQGVEAALAVEEPAEVGNGFGILFI